MPKDMSADTRIEAIAGKSVELPNGNFIANAEMTRSGMDLHLTGANGHTIIVEGYFAQMPAPDLVTHDGARLTPAMVSSFVPPEHAGQYAASGQIANDASPAGKITQVVGDAHIIHADGTKILATVGALIFQGDVIETSKTGAVNIQFADNTTFAISESARMSVDQFVYHSADHTGSTFFSMLQGVFVYTSGLIGKSDPGSVNIETPVGSIGIRGTVVAGHILPAGQNSQITIVDGAVTLTNGSGTQEMNTSLATVSLNSYQAQPSTVPMDANTFNNSYHSVSSVASDTLGHFTGMTAPAAEHAPAATAPAATGSGNEAAPATAPVPAATHAPVAAPVAPAAAPTGSAAPAPAAENTSAPAPTTAAAPAPTVTDAPSAPPPPASTTSTFSNGATASGASDTASSAGTFAAPAAANSTAGTSSAASTTTAPASTGTTSEPATGTTTTTPPAGTTGTGPTPLQLAVSAAQAAATTAFSAASAATANATTVHADALAAANSATAAQTAATAAAANSATDPTDAAAAQSSATAAAALATAAHNADIDAASQATAAHTAATSANIAYQAALVATDAPTAQSAAATAATYATAAQAAATAGAADLTSAGTAATTAATDQASAQNSLSAVTAAVANTATAAAVTAATASVAAANTALANATSYESTTHSNYLATQSAAATANTAYTTIQTEPGALPADILALQTASTSASNALASATTANTDASNQLAAATAAYTAANTALTNAEAAQTASNVSAAQAAATAAAGDATTAVNAAGLANADVGTTTAYLSTANSDAVIGTAFRMTSVFSTAYTNNTTGTTLDDGVKEFAAAGTVIAHVAPVNSGADNITYAVTVLSNNSPVEILPGGSTQALSSTPNAVFSINSSGNLVVDNPLALSSYENQNGIMINIAITDTATSTTVNDQLTIQIHNEPGLTLFGTEAQGAPLVETGNYTASTADQFIIGAGAAGQVLSDGGFTNDVIIGNSGGDTIIVSNNAFQYINGGSGAFNSLQLATASPQAWDVTNGSLSTVTNIQDINLSTSGSSITLDNQVLAGITGTTTNPALEVDMSQGNVIINNAAGTADMVYQVTPNNTAYSIGTHTVYGMMFQDAAGNSLVVAPDASVGGSGVQVTVENSLNSANNGHYTAFQVSDLQGINSVVGMLGSAGDTYAITGGQSGYNHLEYGGGVNTMLAIDAAPIFSIVGNQLVVTDPTALGFSVNSEITLDIHDNTANTDATVSVFIADPFGSTVTPGAVLMDNSAGGATVTATANNETVWGGQGTTGDTLFDGGTGVFTGDVLIGNNAGNTTIEVSNNSFAFIDGGTGADNTLKLQTSGAAFNIDFTSLANIARNIDNIDLGVASGSNGNSVTLNVQDVFDMTNSADNHTLNIQELNGVSNSAVNVITSNANAALDFTLTSGGGIAGTTQTYAGSYNGTNVTLVIHDTTTVGTNHIAVHAV